MRIHLAVVGVLAGALTTRVDGAPAAHLTGRNAACSLATARDGQAPRQPSVHLRCLTGRIAAAIEFGISRSATFSRLIAAIETSNTFVYLEDGYCREGIRSCLQLVSSINGTRYLMVRVDAWQPTTSVVRQLAHEFQHVVEIAGRPEVTEQRQVEQLYEQIGFRTPGVPAGESWETREALDVEEQVYREMRTSHRSMVPSYFGVWTLNPEKSRFAPNTDPGDVVRIHRDQGHELISIIVQSRDASSIRERRALVLKLDGRDYVVSVGNEEREFVAMTLIDSLTLSFLIKRNDEVVTSGIESVSRDGRILTVETCAIGETGAVIKSIAIWEKTGS